MDLRTNSSPLAYAAQAKKAFWLLSRFQERAYSFRLLMQFESECLATKQWIGQILQFHGRKFFL